MNKNIFALITLVFLSLSNLFAQTHLVTFMEFGPANGDTMVVTSEGRFFYTDTLKVEVKEDSTLQWFVHYQVKSKEVADSISTKNGGSTSFSKVPAPKGTAPVVQKISSDSLIEKAVEVVLAKPAERNIEAVTETKHNADMMPTITPTIPMTGNVPVQMYVETFVLVKPSPADFKDHDYRYVQISQDEWLAFSKEMTSSPKTENSMKILAASEKTELLMYGEEPFLWGLKIFTNYNEPFLLRNETITLKVKEDKHLTYFVRFYSTREEAVEAGKKYFSDINDVVPIRFKIK